VSAAASWIYADLLAEAAQRLAMLVHERVAALGALVRIPR
jgi:hypothetical protein